MVLADVHLVQRVCAPTPEVVRHAHEPCVRNCERKVPPKLLSREGFVAPNCPPRTELNADVPAPRVRRELSAMKLRTLHSHGIAEREPLLKLALFDEAV